jgi:TonB family protein
MFRDETQFDSHLERSAPLPLPIPSDEDGGQRKRMLMALGILLLALAAVVLKDWDFWFPPSPEAQEETFHRKHMSVAAAVAGAPAVGAREHKPAKPAAPATAPATSEIPFATTTERAALPPLEVEVVAGNRHINVPAKSNSIHVDVDSGQMSAPSPAAPAPNPVVNAGDRVELSPQTAQSVTVSVPPNYPMLARQMKVQGAVSLQVLISREGTIQELQILSGPPILATAAREAVKQWHFKPYLLNGQPVETQARVTVNFTISTN